VCYLVKNRDKFTFTILVSLSSMDINEACTARVADGEARVIQV